MLASGGTRYPNSVIFTNEEILTWRDAAALQPDGKPLEIPLP